MACRDGCGDGAERRSRTRAETPAKRLEVARPGGKFPAPRSSHWSRWPTASTILSAFQSRTTVPAASLWSSASAGSRSWQGRQGAAEPFLDLTKTNPLGIGSADGLRRAGPVVDRVPPEVQGQRTRLRALCVAAVQRRLDRRPLHGRPQSPDGSPPSGEQDGQGDHEHPAAVL